MAANAPTAGGRCHLRRRVRSPTVHSEFAAAAGGVPNWARGTPGALDGTRPVHAVGVATGARRAAGGGQAARDSSPWQGRTMRASRGAPVCRRPQPTRWRIATGARGCHGGRDCARPGGNAPGASNTGRAHINKTYQRRRKVHTTRPHEGVATKKRKKTHGTTREGSGPAPGQQSETVAAIYQPKKKTATRRVVGGRGKATPLARFTLGSNPTQSTRTSTAGAGKTRRHSAPASPPKKGQTRTDPVHTFTTLDWGESPAPSPPTAGWRW